MGIASLNPSYDGVSPVSCKRALPAISRAGRAPTLEWRGWGGVGADLIRDPRRDVRLSRTRSAPTGGGIPCFPTTCSGPCPQFARRARSYIGMAWVGRRRSGSHPRSAPERPAIADKVRSYGGGGIPCSPATCRSGPCPRFARRARSYRGMAWWGGVGADLIRDPRRDIRLSRTRSAPTGEEEYRAPRQPVGAGPVRDFARRARSYMGMAWVGRRRSGSHPRSAPGRPAIVHCWVRALLLLSSCCSAALARSGGRKSLSGL